MTQMHQSVRDIAGMRSGRLVALSYVGRKSRSTMWLCRCDCGTEKEVASLSIVKKGTMSCGCLKREQAAEQIRKLRTTHGRSGTSEYNIWNAIRDRCQNPMNSGYHRYGGRGIKMCDRWRSSFENFYADMGPRPKGHSIERINNDGDYEPGNCRWATPSDQAINKRNNRHITYRGRTQCVQFWENELNLPKGHIRQRLNKGWTIEEAFETADGRFKENQSQNRVSFKDRARKSPSTVWIEHEGHRRCLSEWAEITGIGLSALWSRLNKRGWPVSKALGTPARPMRKFQRRIKNEREI